MTEILLEVRNLKTYFYTDEGVVRALDGVSFEIQKGRTLGVLGESGCGKTIASLSILRLIQSPGKIVEGEIQYHNGTSTTDLTALEANSQQMRRIRGGEIAMIFQEPMTSFDPLYTIGDQIMEGVIQHQNTDAKGARKVAIDALHRVGMPDPHKTIDRYPHQLSGGMRQRAMIAMALACSPKLLIADEPTTALDVTTEAQILELLETLKENMGMTIMYIKHNLGVIAEMAEDVIVMYLGQVVEKSDVVTLFTDPKHPYTRALISSIPKLGSRGAKGKLEAIRGIIPSPYNIPTGCRFHPRCNAFMSGVCDVAVPPEVNLGDGHSVKCFLYIDEHEKVKADG